MVLPVGPCLNKRVNNRRCLISTMEMPTSIATLLASRGVFARGRFVPVVVSLGGRMPPIGGCGFERVCRSLQLLCGYGHPFLSLLYYKTARLISLNTFRG
jgi:hypothetical protein